MINFWLVIIQRQKSGVIHEWPYVIRKEREGQAHRVGQWKKAGTNSRCGSGLPGPFLMAADTINQSRTRVIACDISKKHLSSLFLYRPPEGQQKGFLWMVKVFCDYYSPRELTIARSKAMICRALHILYYLPRWAIAWFVYIHTPQGSARGYKFLRRTTLQWWSKGWLPVKLSLDTLMWPLGRVP